MVEFKFKISDEAFNLLMYIKEHKQAEYRDNEFEYIDDFIKSNNEFMTVEQFKHRNCNGTYYLIKELEIHNLVCSNNFAWHPTFILTEIGKKMLENNCRRIKLENLNKI